MQLLPIGCLSKDMSLSHTVLLSFLLNINCKTCLFSHFSISGSYTAQDGVLQALAACVEIQLFEREFVFTSDSHLLLPTREDFTLNSVTTLVEVFSDHVCSANSGSNLCEYRFVHVLQAILFPLCTKGQG